MASPQCENGYTRLANELLEALSRLRIPGEARQVFDTIMRKTYGFGKKEDGISLSQFVLATGLLKNHICDSLNKLKRMNLITEKGNDVTNIYSINKDYTSWKPLPKKVTLPKKVMTITEKGNESLPKKVPTIDNNTKETITKEIYILEFEYLWKLYPNKDGKKEALRHYKASVKTEQDRLDIKKALDNYLKSGKVSNGYVKNGSTWFNNWKDWIDYMEVVPKQETVDERHKRELEETKRRLGL